MADNKVTEINVEAIMDSIKENIKKNGIDKQPLSFADKAEGINSIDGDLYEAVQYISYNYELNPYQVYTGNPLKVFVKKAIRKIANFFVIPIVVQQNRVNANFMIVSDNVRDQKDEIENMKRMLEEVNKKIEKLEKLAK